MERNYLTITFLITILAGLIISSFSTVSGQSRTHDSCRPIISTTQLLAASESDLIIQLEEFTEHRRTHTLYALTLLHIDIGEYENSGSLHSDPGADTSSLSWTSILLAARPPDNGRDGQAVVFSDDLGFEIVEADDLASDSLLRAIVLLRRERPDPGAALDAALLARHGMSGTCDPAGRSLAALAVSEALIALAEEEEAARKEADSPHDPAAPGRHILSGAYYEYALCWAVIAHDEGLDWPFVVLRSLELMARAEPEIRWRPDAPADARVLERFARAPDILGPLSNDPRLASAEARLQDR